MQVSRLAHAQLVQCLEGGYHVRQNVVEVFHEHLYIPYAQQQSLVCMFTCCSAFDWHLQLCKFGHMGPGRDKDEWCFTQWT